MVARTATATQVSQGRRAGDKGTARTKAGDTRTARPAGRPPRSREPVSGAAASSGPPPRKIDGKAVVSDEPVLSGLSSKGGRSVELRMRRLTLADGGVVIGCADCEFVGSTRGEAQVHRARVHPGRKAQKKDPVGPLGLEISLGELLELARSAAHWGSIVDSLTAERDKVKAERDALKSQLAKLTAALGRLGFKPDETRDDL